jgi:hypothetical protein
VHYPRPGVFFPAQIYYTGSCSNPGTGRLNDGEGPTNDPVENIFGKTLVFSAA